MRFSTTIEYAIHGLIYLARVPVGRAVLIGNIAEAIEVPQAYLRKVFQRLSRTGILTSQRGARGGFRLSRDSGQINLKDVVEAIDGSLPVYTCMRVLRGCGLSVSCPVQEAFERARLQMAKVLEATSIKNLLDDISRQQPEVEWLKVTV
jgi:Rrf2 family protein